MNKICVYAICKNESKFVDRWISALQGEADCVVVLDTGSTDDTVEKLKKYGIDPGGAAKMIIESYLNSVQ